MSTRHPENSLFIGDRIKSIDLGRYSLDLTCWDFLLGDPDRKRRVAQGQFVKFQVAANTGVPVVDGHLGWLQLLAKLVEN